MNHYNTIGIDSQLDWPRIRKFFCIGLLAACLVLAGDMLLGWSVTAILIARLVGNHAITNALSTGWISIGNLWMFGGLLVMMNKAKINSI